MTDLPVPLPPHLPPQGMPLTAFEEHMLLDDRPSHPMAIVTRFDFTDASPPAALEEAFYKTLKSEPLLTARVIAPRWGRPRWCGAEPPRLQWSKAHSLAENNVEWTGSPPRLDPATGNALHAEVIEHNDGWSIFMAVHHAACDGLGIVGFLERWLLATEGKRTRWRRPPDAMMAALTTRGRIATSWPEFSRMLPKLAKGLEGVGEFVGHDVAELSASTTLAGPCESSSSPHSWQPLILAATVDGEVVAGLEATAKASTVSVNDLLATALLFAIAEQVPEQASPWIRLAIPMSLRTKTDHVLPASNRVSMVFLDRRPEDCRDPVMLATGIRDQMEIIRSHALGHIFPMSLEVGRMLPGGLARSVKRPKPQCTAVLSNVGRFFHRSPLADANGTIRVGGSRLTGWWGVPPIRPGTALAVGTHETAGRRTVAFHVDRNRLPADDARSLLEATIAKLSGFAATAALSLTPARVS
jgi:hypothetical protein